jgi:leucyl/phenylalanyl-tRNA--protein transferase
MLHTGLPYPLPWLEPGDAFPSSVGAWPAQSDAPGLLAAGGDLSVPTLRKALVRFATTPGCEIRIDSAFSCVIEACAATPRSGQSGTWIVPQMVRAYTQLHQSGQAHSVETWVNGQLVGGLYCVALGRAVFGESMFSHQSDASKIALAALVCLCRQHGVHHIDCQQNTDHLASLGAAEVPRNVFLAHIRAATGAPPLQWQFSPLYWNHILSA